MCLRDSGKFKKFTQANSARSHFFEKWFARKPANFQDFAQFHLVQEGELLTLEFTREADDGSARRNYFRHRRQKYKHCRYRNRKTTLLEVWKATNMDSILKNLAARQFCLTFGNEISPELNDKVLQLDLLLNYSPFSGFTESVPTYSSISVFYDVVKVVRAFPAFDTAFEAARSAACASLVQTKSEDGKRTSREMIVRLISIENMPSISI